MEEKLLQLQKRLDELKKGGGAKRIEKQHSQGKMTARERIEKLLDPDTFTELDMHVSHRGTSFGMEKLKAPAEGVVTGYGTINNRLVYIYAQDFTVMGGSLGEMHAKKISKVLDMAVKVGAPCIGINDSGGARIQEGVDALSGYGQIFNRNVLASGVIPQIAVVMGPCAGGAVYSPALMDFIFTVENKSRMFITGPQVIKAVTGEEVDQETLGGSLIHNEKSGVAHFNSATEADCLDKVKALLAYLPNMEDNPVSFKYSIGEKQEQANLGFNETLTLMLLPRELSKLRLSNVQGSIGVTAVYLAGGADSSASGVDGVKLTRTYGNEFKANNLIKVSITYEVGDKAPDGVYLITDHLPAGLKIVQRPYTWGIDDIKAGYPIEVAGQRIVFAAYGKTKQTFNYYARVVNSGEFLAEPAYIQHLKSGMVFHNTPKDRVSIP
jgi:hypothetical protein